MIKNIIFDFGTVLIPLDEELTWTALDKLGAQPELAGQTKIFRAYEKGKTTTKEFLKQTQPFFFRKNIFPDDLGDAWNAMLHTPLENDVIRLLKRLKRDYKLFLLSNTNDLHISKIKEDAGPFTYGQFIKQFDGIYYSHEIGMRKPDKEIFQKVLKDHKLKAGECLFIDDKEENTKGAAKLGIHTWHYVAGEDDILRIKKKLEALENEGMQTAES